MSTWMMIAKIVGVFLVSYAIGCFSSAYLIGWFKKIDIREHGSGNAGTTNAMRVMGAKAGVIVLLLDVLKGFIATVIGYYLFSWGVDEARMAEFARYGVYLSGFSVVVGHNWPVNLGFRGGKGVATTLGIFFISQPWMALGTFILFLILNYVLKLVSVSSLLSMAAFCVSFALYRLNTMAMSVVETWIFLIYLCVMMGLMIYTHRSNLVRLFQGKENRLSMINMVIGKKDKNESEKA